MKEPILDDDLLGIDNSEIRRNLKISGGIRLLVSFFVTFIVTTAIVWFFDTFGTPTSGIIFKILFGFACIVAVQLFIFLQIIRALQEIIHPKIFDRVPPWEKDYRGGFKIFILWCFIVVGAGHLAYRLYPYHGNIYNVVFLIIITFIIWKYRTRLKIEKTRQ